MKIVIDGQDNGRIFQGIGGVFSNGMTKLLEDYPKEQRQDILRFLFEDNFGASLQHVKVEIGSDVNTSSGTVPSHMRAREDLDITRGSELWIAKLARQINPAITMEALRWGTPAWITDEEDKYYYYLHFLKGAKEKFGIAFDYLGCDQNEGSFDRDWVVRTLAPGLKKDGFGNIKLVAAESDSGWQIAEDVREDRELDSITSVLNCHYTIESTEAAVGTGKPLWSGEHLAGMRHDFAGGALTAAYYMLAMYPVGKLTMYEMHPALEANYPSTPFNYKGMIAASWPWSGCYEVTPGLWTTAHFTQFIKPGWQYMDSACLAGNDKLGEEKCGCVALKAPDGINWSLIVINCSDTAKEYEWEVTGGLQADRLYVWMTDERETFIQKEDIVPADGTFHITIPPYTMYSVTTTTGQKKGRPKAMIPSEKEMSLPWLDDFSGYPAGRQPKYASDQGGAFEIGSVSSRSVLIQRITQDTKPIDWVYRTTPSPYTLLGSELWTDYQVEAEMLLPETDSFGYVAGRCVNNGKFDMFPSCYLFCLQGDGTWKLKRQDVVLKEGKSRGLAKNKFHHLRIAFAGNKLSAYLNGELTAQAEDSFFSAGQAVLGSSYHEVCIANLCIRPTAETEYSCNRYSDKDSRLYFSGNWLRKDGDYANFGRTLTYSQEAGSRLSFTFEGTGACIIGNRDRIGGMADIFVDGSYHMTADTYCETENDRKTGLSVPKSRNTIATVYGLPTGRHTILLVTTEQKNTASQGQTVSIDAIEIIAGVLQTPNTVIPRCKTKKIKNT